jgi:hypothetical protein
MTTFTVTEEVYDDSGVRHESFTIEADEYSFERAGDDGHIVFINFHEDGVRVASVNASEVRRIEREG